MADTNVSWEDLNLGLLLREALQDRVMVLIPGKQGVEVRLLDRGHLAALHLLTQEEHQEAQSKEKQP